MRTALVLLVLAVLAWAVGGYDLTTFAEPKGWERALGRLGDFLTALGHPDLSYGFVSRAAGLAATSLAIAVLGTCLGAAGGVVLGLLASRNVLLGDAAGWAPIPGRFLCGAARLVQDVLRGVPDFAWAVMSIPILGLGPGAGVAALALNISGILGRLYSEIFDTVSPRLLEPLRAAGAGRLQTFLYGILPAARPGAISVSLLRWECAVRNSAVIGVVGGGGLGSELLLRLSYGEYDKLLTLLFFLVLLTVGSDLVSQAVRQRLRHDPDLPPERGGADTLARERRRILGLAATLAVLVAWAAYRVVPSLGETLAREGWAEAGRAFGGLLRPDLSAAALKRAVASAAVPVSMAFLGTGLAALLAAALAYPASWSFQMGGGSFTGERASRWIRGARAAALVLARGAALLGRAIPEVFWAMLLVSLFRLGTLPGMLALTLHSVGLLTRLFSESVDAVPLRTLEVAYAASGSRAKSFLYGAVPTALPDWMANVFFQFESNVRAAVVLGIVGVGGLGFLFSFEFEFFRFERAATYLVVMVALAVSLDRLSRVLGLARTRVE